MVDKADKIRGHTPLTSGESSMTDTVSSTGNRAGAGGRGIATTHDQWRHLSVGNTAFGIVGYRHAMAMEKNPARPVQTPLNAICT